MTFLASTRVDVLRGVTFEVEPGETVVVCQNGVFGGRMKENVIRVGATPVMVQDDFGTAIDLNKVEAALKQALRIAATQESLKADTDFSASANLLRCYVVGRWEQYARSGFKREPLGQWPMQWPMLYCACLSQSAAPVRRKQ